METKTITMPLSEYEDMRAEIIRLKTQPSDYERLKEEYEELQGKYVMAVDRGDRLMFEASMSDNFKRMYECERAERYDFNARALRLIAGMYYEMYSNPKEVKLKLDICKNNIKSAKEDAEKEDLLPTKEDE